MFEIMVTIEIKSVFHLEMHQNNFFYFLKNIFEISISKGFKNIKK
jgi:hypothetical protein